MKGNTTQPKVPPRIASQKPEIRQKTCTMKPAQAPNGKRRRREREGRPRQVGSVGGPGGSEIFFARFICNQYSSCTRQLSVQVCNMQKPLISPPIRSCSFLHGKSLTDTLVQIFSFCFIPCARPGSSPSFFPLRSCLDSSVGVQPLNWKGTTHSLGHSLHRRTRLRPSRLHDFLPRKRHRNGQTPLTKKSIGSV